MTSSTTQPTCWNVLVAFFHDRRHVGIHTQPAEVGTPRHTQALNAFLEPTQQLL